MVYLDNAATGGFKPKCVFDAINAALKNLSANPGRSGHNKSVNCLKLITKTRENVADYFGCDNAENVIFTKNCTEALNIAILGSITYPCHVITSANDHNSTLRPLFELKKQNKISLSVVEPDEYLNITASNVYAHICENTKFICLNLVSNVTGGTAETEKIAKICKEKNITLICDAAQAAGHIDINMRTMGIDILAFPGHKSLCGPTGIGGLCFNGNIKIMPILFGGTGTESKNVYQPEGYPESLESGTLNIIGIAGLNAALKYIKDNKQKMRENLDFLSTFFLENLSKNKKIKIYSVKNSCGIVSILTDGYSSMDIADILNARYKIAVRAGLHCAPLIHKHLNTLDQGLVRYSLSSFNNIQEIAYALQSLKEITLK